MFDESIVNIVFRLINFVALLGFAAYIYKRYFFSDITEKINQEETEKETLCHQIGELDQQSNTLSHEIIAQEEHCKELQTRVTQWQHVFNQEMETRRKDSLNLRIKSAERADRQKKFVEQEDLINAVFPQAIEQINSSLINTFSDSDRNEKFIADIIGIMKKRS